MRYALLLLLSTLPALCQLPVVPLQTTPVSGVPGPSSIIGLRYWWVSSDMAVGVTVSNQWADRIQGNLAAQMQTSLQPTNAALGVRFNGGQRLTNSTLFPVTVNASTGSVVVIFQPETPAGFGAMLGNDLTGGGLMATSGNTIRVFAAGSPTLSAFTSGQKMDLYYIITNSTQPNTYVSTNGVARGLFTGGPWSNNQKFFGEDGAGDFFKGYIREVIWYSNTLTAPQVATLHTYATNTYGYTP